MKAGILILLVFILAHLSVRADDHSAALEKLRKIPAAQGTVINWDQSKVPSLILTARGAFINNSKIPVPFDQVLKALADLPKEAWPCGRVIMYSPFPPGLTTDHQPLPSDVKKVEADLKAAGIQLDIGVSA